MALNCPHVSGGTSPKWSSDSPAGAIVLAPSNGRAEGGRLPVRTPVSCSGEPQSPPWMLPELCLLVPTLPPAPEAGLPYSQPGEDHWRATDGFAGRVCPGRRLQARN